MHITKCGRNLVLCLVLTPSLSLSFALYFRCTWKKKWFCICECCTLILILLLKAVCFSAIHVYAHTFLLLLPLEWRIEISVHQTKIHTKSIYIFSLCVCCVFVFVFVSFIRCHSNGILHIHTHWEWVLWIEHFLCNTETLLHTIVCRIRSLERKTMKNRKKTRDRIENKRKQNRLI